MNKIAEHAEDIALATGTVLCGVGAGVAFGVGIGILVFGALVVAYGVWITTSNKAG